MSKSRAFLRPLRSEGHLSTAPVAPSDEKLLHVFSVLVRRGREALAVEELAVALEENPALSVAEQIRVLEALL